MSYAPDDVAKWLATQCLGLDYGENLFSGEWGEDGDEIDEQVIVKLSPVPPSPLKDLYETVGIQILVRGSRNKGAATTYALAERISATILSPTSTLEMGCTCYTDWEEISDIGELGRDENGRHIFSMNFSSHRNRLAMSHV